MNNKKMSGHRGSVFFHILISLAAAIAAELFLFANVSLLNQVLVQIGYGGPLSIQESGYELVLLLVYSLLGMLVFAGCFALLQLKNVRYMRRIAEVMRLISEGNLEEKMDVVGEDELADIAFRLNRMAEEVSLLMDRERKAEKSKNDLITNIAHDLRTPLTSILGYLELLKSRTDLDLATKNNYVSIAYEKAQHLQQLIEDLFGFTKLNYGRLTANLKPLDLIRLLEQLLEEFYPVFEKNHMEYRFHSQVPSQIILGDGTLLARLFDNLLNNAVKYGREGKQILVEVRLEKEKLLVDVVNYGGVIAKSDLEHVFDKFYRAEQSRPSETGGTGLGLAIAKSVAELHGGCIRADSSLQGTVFEVEFPVRQEKEETADDIKQP